MFNFTDTSTYDEAVVEAFGNHQNKANYHNDEQVYLQEEYILC